MDSQNEENLKELFGKFLNAEQAEQAVEDVRRGERILREQAGPEPDSKLVADIKAEIEAALLRRKTRVLRRAAYKAAAVAAVFIILAVTTVKLFERGGGESEGVIVASKIAEVIWESEDISADDVDLATLVAEAEQIESEVLALQLGETNGNGYGDLVELEMELIEINSDFWKG